MQNKRKAFTLADGTPYTNKKIEEFLLKPVRNWESVVPKYNNVSPKKR